MNNAIDDICLQSEIERLQQEVAELQKTNQSLLVYKQQLDAILNNAPVEVYLKDREGRYLRINKQFEKIFCVRNEDIVGLLPTDIHDNELALSTRDHDLSVLRSGVAERREEQALLASDQQVHTLLTIKFPVYDDDGKVDGLGAIVTDITERKQAEESLRRAQKMEAIGELTGGIAHDFNNILGIVIGNLELIQIMAKADEKLLIHAAAAFKGATRGAELTKKLLRFSQSSEALARPVFLNTFLMGMEALVAKSLTVSVDTKWNLSERLWTVHIDPGELEDAIINLSLNSFDAMPEGGELIFTTTNQTVEKTLVSATSQVPPGDYVVLSVRDTGIGMNPEVLKRATEPFFTTKTASQGTGLGLSIVYGFLTRSGGYMDMTSEPGKGTNIRLFLPRVDAQVHSESTGQVNYQYHRGEETILIVDDETSLVDIAVAHLQDLGYTTLTAHSGEQALDVLHAHPGIDLLFADVIMPGSMNGYTLAAAARKAYPSLKLLITSGFTQRYNALDIDKPDHTSTLLDNLLRKPYDKMSLSSAIRSALDQENVSS